MRYPEDFHKDREDELDDPIFLKTRNEHDYDVLDAIVTVVVVILLFGMIAALFLLGMQ